MPGRSAMFAQGLIEETKELLARYGRSPALDSLGYRQAAQYLDGALTWSKPLPPPARVTATMPSASSPGFAASLKFAG